MRTELPPVPESCRCCPHLDPFHASCTHDLRQAVIQELADEDRTDCPLYPGVRAEAMQELVRENSF